MNAPARPDSMVGRLVPDLTLVAHDGLPYGLRERIGREPQVLFFYIKNGTPG